MTQAPLRSDFLGVDEDMEISSEAGRGAESDIEIFDLDDDTATVTNDDEMIDEHEYNVKDEDMNEEFPRENTVDMDDEIVFDEDVEITEVEDTAPAAEPKDAAPTSQPDHKQAPAMNLSNEIVDEPLLEDHSPNIATTAAPVTNSIKNDHATQANSAVDAADQEHISIQEVVVENTEDKTTPATEAVTKSGVEPTDVAGEVASDVQDTVDATVLGANATDSSEPGKPDEQAAEPSAVPDLAAGATQTKANDVETTHEAITAQAEEEEHAATAESRQDDDSAVPVNKVAVEAAQDAGHEIAAEVAPSPSLSHEVRVLYDGNDMSLFPPKDPQDTRTYLLQDSALIHAAVAELFPACRTLLGSSIAEKDELLLEIPDLGLRIYERCSRQPASSLSDVVDVYLALSYNDSSEEPGPLYLHLEVVPDFQSKLDSLHELASDGKGFSSLIEPGDSGDEEGWEENALAEHAEAEDDSIPTKAEENASVSTMAAAETNVEVTSDASEHEVSTEVPHEETFELDLAAVPEDETTDAAAPPAVIDLVTSAAEESEETVIGEEITEKDEEAAKESQEAVTAAAEEDEEDFIDYTDDEEDTGTPVTPSISHKRSWEEHTESSEQPTEGGSAKRAKA